jgi:hypothetical protein
MQLLFKLDRYYLSKHAVGGRRSVSFKRQEGRARRSREEVLFATAAGTVTLIALDDFG